DADNDQLSVTPLVGLGKSSLLNTESAVEYGRLAAGCGAYAGGGGWGVYTGVNHKIGEVHDGAATMDWMDTKIR
ncbi:hypothetical protein O5833_27245, partial [Escherichia coli]|nr:hypothetical protein [Escherichia coli]